MTSHVPATLTARVVIGMTLGAALGLLLNLGGWATPGGWVDYYLLDGLFQVIGTLFVNALKMLVVPLVLLSLIGGVCGIGDLNALGRVGLKTFFWFLLTTALAIATALALASVSGIGHGMNLPPAASYVGKEAPPLVSVITHLIPSNPLAAMVNGEMLQVIVFALLLGIGLLQVGARARPLITAAAVANEVMLRLVLLVMATAPYAVFALLAKSMAELGLPLLIQLAGYVLILVTALALHFYVTLMLLLKLFGRVAIRPFLRKIRTTQLFAFSTSSSNATLPVTLQTTTERMGVHPSVAAFTVPLGATINMDGTAIMQGVATVFIAQLYGVELGLTGYLTVLAMAVLASIGTAGVPGVGLVMLTLVFVQVGLPVEGIGLILGVDRLLDMLRTAVNVSGDVVVSVIVARSEGKLDMAVYPAATPDSDHAGT